VVVVDKLKTGARPRHEDTGSMGWFDFVDAARTTKISPKNIASNGRSLCHGGLQQYGVSMAGWDMVYVYVRRRAAEAVKR
jgi:hypothetical protein